LSEEKPIYYLNPSWNTLCSGSYLYPQYPPLTTGSTTVQWVIPTPVTISQYNELLSLYLDRGTEIERLQAVVRNVAHYLIAKQDVDGLNSVEEALLLECERAMEGKE
jgi:hypothetical protein